MAGLTYIGSRPTLYQMGDLVLAIVDQQHVQGRITSYVNLDRVMLDCGRVEIEVDGQRHWVQAIRVVKTAGEVDHPLKEVVPAFVWRCEGCRATGYALTKEQAVEDHQSHSNRHSGEG